MTKIVFVCLGNICRSPMAEFILKSRAPAGWKIASRATGSWEQGNSIHNGAQEVLQQHGIPWDKAKVSQMIQPDDFHYFDDILAMDAQNVRDLRRLAPAGTAHKIKLFMAQSVPDPWYTGDFEQTYDLILKGCENLLNGL